MKIFDSLKTINYTHQLMKKLNDKQKEELMSALTALFYKKQVSEDGEYKTFKVTQDEVTSIYNEMYG